MFNEFGTVDGRDEKYGLGAGWAITFVDGAMEFALQDRLVNLAQIGGGGFVFDANHDTVRMEEVSDRCAFAEKFRVRCHAKRVFSAAAIGGQRSLQLESGACRYGAFFDHKLGRPGLLCYLPRNLVDG